MTAIDLIERLQSLIAKNNFRDFEVIFAYYWEDVISESDYGSYSETVASVAIKISVDKENGASFNIQFPEPVILIQAEMYGDCIFRMDDKEDKQKLIKFLENK